MRTEWGRGACGAHGRGRQARRVGAPVELREPVPAVGVRVVVERDGRRDERRRDARDDDRRHRPGRAGVGVVEQCDGLQDRRGDALEDALDHLAKDHRGLRVDRRARVVLRAVC